MQLAVKEDDSQKLDPNGIKLMQIIVGAVLHYGRMIDSTVLVACNDIASQQSSATEKTLRLSAWLLDYLASNPSASIACKKSDMQYWVSSDASYLLASKDRSHVSSYHFLGNIANFTK